MYLSLWILSRTAGLWCLYVEVWRLIIQRSPVNVDAVFWNIWHAAVFSKSLFGKEREKNVLKYSSFIALFQWNFKWSSACLYFICWSFSLMWWSVHDNVQSFILWFSCVWLVQFVFLFGFFLFVFCFCFFVKYF